MRHARTVLAITACVGLAACSDSATDAPTADAAPVAAQQADAEGAGSDPQRPATRTGAGAALPDGFPDGVPMPADRIVVMASPVGDDRWQVALTLAEADADRALDDLTQRMTADGWDVRDDGDDDRIVAAKDGMSYRLMRVGEPLDGRVKLSLSLVLS